MPPMRARPVRPGVAVRLRYRATVSSSITFDAKGETFQENKQLAKERKVSASRRWQERVSQREKLGKNAKGETVQEVTCVTCACTPRMRRLGRSAPHRRRTTRKLPRPRHTRDDSHRHRDHRGRHRLVQQQRREQQPEERLQQL